MKNKQKFYKIEALVSKKDIDEKMKELKSETTSPSTIIFNAIKNNGITVFEVSSHSASAIIQPKYITLDVSGNGDSINRKDFKRFEIEEDINFDYEKHRG